MLFRWIHFIFWTHSFTSSHLTAFTMTLQWISGVTWTIPLKCESTAACYCGFEPLVVVVLPLVFTLPAACSDLAFIAISARFLESLHYAALRCLWTAVARFWCIMQDSPGFISPNTFFCPPWRNERLWFAYILASLPPPPLLTHQPSARRWLCICREGQFGTNQRDRMFLHTCAQLYTFWLPLPPPTTACHRDSRARRDWTGCSLHDSALIWYSVSELVLRWDE